MKSLKIFTGCYYKCKKGNLVSISGDKGKRIGFLGSSYIKFAPKKDFWEIWHDNIGKIDEDENNIYYMHEFYKQVLSKLDANQVLEELQFFGENVVLLCYEEENEFCHRHLIAIWLERILQIQVPEIYVTDEKKFEYLERNQKYIKQFNEVLDVYIKERGE